MVANAIVAGAREGEGAEDVVWVRDCAERDLSRNSTIDCQSVMSARASSGDGSVLMRYLGVLNCLVTTLDIWGKRLLQWDDQSRYST